MSSFSFVPKRRLPCTSGEARVCSASPKAIQRSSVVERSAVNRLVVGSNPTAGANVKSLEVSDFSSWQDRKNEKCQQICQQTDSRMRNSHELCRNSATTR